MNNSSMTRYQFLFQLISGVDTAGLAAQIEEKRLRNQVENERKNAYDSEMIKNSQICTLLDTRQKNDTMRQNVELNKFRFVYI